MKALTIRIDDETAEALRVLAFDTRESQMAHIRSALDAYLHSARLSRVDSNGDSLGCDVCGKPHTRVSTPGGFRFCDDHDEHDTSGRI